MNTNTDIICETPLTRIAWERNHSRLLLSALKIEARQNVEKGPWDRDPDLNQISEEIQETREHIQACERALLSCFALPNARRIP